MCRDKEHGGRLCPSQNNPAKNKAHNAQRRAKYNAPKNSQLFPQEDYRKASFSSSTVMSKEYISAITPEQKAALWSYSEMESSNTNKYLYSSDFKNAVDNELDSIHHRDDLTDKNYLNYKKQLKKEITDRIEIIDEAMKLCLPTPTLLYHGFDIEIPQGKDPFTHIESIHAIGSLYSRPSYISATTNPSVAAAFTTDRKGTPVIYEILTTQGAPLRELSALSTEDEVLLPRDKKFRVVQVTKKVSFDDVGLGEDDTISSLNSQSSIIVIQLIEE